MKKNVIPEKERVFAPFSTIDSVGRVFFWKEKVFREIYPDSQAEVLSLMQSGLISELGDEGLFPKTKISSYSVKNSELVLEHEKIETVSYPYEWSFSMFKDAAICVLKVNQIAKKYGYQTKDCHGYNILFQKNRPLFVDFGSFIKRDEKDSGWVASEEFIRYYYYPLVLWSNGYEHLATRIIRDPLEMLPYSEYFQLMYPILRLIPLNILQLINSYYFSFSRINSLPDSTLRARLSPLLYFFLKNLKKHSLLPFQSFHFEKELKKINDVTNYSKTFWSGYQDETKVTSRFRYISTIIKNQHIKTMIDVAGNQGVFAKHAMAFSKVNKVYCVDYDQSAIDVLYRDLQQKNQNIVPLVQNVIFPFSIRPDLELVSRIRSEAVVALALTHHLLLTQNMSYEVIFSSLKKFTTKYVFIEFMPLGLFNGKSSPPVPHWYSQEQFAFHFKKYFTLIEIKNLAKNRVLFVGKLFD